MNRIVKVCVFVYLTLTAGSAFAGLPACRTQDGQSVDMVNATAQELKVLGIAHSTAMLGNYDKPLILLDLESLIKLPISYQMFVYLHECAHHQLGHVSKENRIMEMTMGKVNIEREDEADCVGIKRLVKELGADANDLAEIQNVMVQQFGVSSSRTENGKPVKKGQFKFYKPIEQRNADLLKCFNEAH
jgi:hypothetical protein